MVLSLPHDGGGSQVCETPIILIAAESGSRRRRPDALPVSDPNPHGPSFNHLHHGSDTWLRHSTSGILLTMPQTATPTGTLIPGIVQRPRKPLGAAPPRLRIQDGLALAGFAVAVLLLRGLSGGPRALTEPMTYLDAVAVAIQYLLGLRARDRYTANIAAGLLLTSRMVVDPHGQSMHDALFTILTLAALTFSITGSTLGAIVAAVFATLVRPEGMALGALLIGLALIDRRPGGVLGLVVYVVLTVLGIAALTFLAHRPFPAVAIHPDIEPLARIFDRQNVLAALFIWPMLDDFTETARASRWKAVLSWTVLILAVQSFVQVAGLGRGPFPCVVYVLAAGGVARMLPHLAGNFPSLSLRYTVAALFFATLFLVRVGTLEPATSPALSQPAPVILPVLPPPSLQSAPILSTASAAKQTAPAEPRPPVTRPASPSATALIPQATATARPAAAKPFASAPVAHLAPAPAAETAVPGVPRDLAAQAAAAGVSTYWERHGHRFARNLWAIRWAIQKARQAYATRAH